MPAAKSLKGPSSGSRTEVRRAAGSEARAPNQAGGSTSTAPIRCRTRFRSRVYANRARLCARFSRPSRSATQGRSTQVRPLFALVDNAELPQVAAQVVESVLNDWNPQRDLRRMSVPEFFSAALGT